MKTLMKLALWGGLAAMAVEIYRRQQRDREYSGASPNASPDIDAGIDSPVGTDNDPVEQVADTNSVVTGDPQQKQRGPQPQDWRGAQNVLE